MTADALMPWPTLREFLDAGGDLFALYPEDDWLEELFVDIPRHLASHRVQFGAYSRPMWEEGVVFMDGTRSKPLSFERRRQHSWECDLWESPELLDRVTSMFSPEATAEGHRLFESYKELGLKILALEGNEQHPYWTCHSCTLPFPPSVPAIVTGEDDEANCRDCVAAVLERYDRGEVDAREEASK